MGDAMCEEKGWEKRKVMGNRVKGGKRKAGRRNGAENGRGEGAKERQRVFND